jgi:hypothetical protein
MYQYKSTIQRPHTVCTNTQLYKSNTHTVRFVFVFEGITYTTLGWDGGSRRRTLEAKGIDSEPTQNNNLNDPIIFVW